MLVDVHTHLTHQLFQDDLAKVIERAQSIGLGAILVNGLEPKSNRQIISLSELYPVIKVALGIYPIDAVAEMLPAGIDHRASAFSVADEIKWIDRECLGGKVTAIGECGLDGHFLPEEFDKPQEEVFRQLIRIANAHDLPVIVHSRKKEQRTAEILKEERVKRVNFHCFTGRSNWAKTWAEENEGWFFSIPSNAVRSESFQKLLKILPPDRLITETDAPYLAKEKNGRSEPADVALTVSLLAKIRAWSEDHARQQIWENYQALTAKPVVGGDLEIIDDEV